MSLVGHFGRVYLARMKAPADPFVLVLKCLTKNEIISKGVRKQVRREIEVCRLVSRMRSA